jgi:hypothetical protein
MLTVVCGCGAAAGTLFAGSTEGIRWMLVVSSFFVALSNGFFAQRASALLLPGRSPWLGFGLVVILGVAVTVATLFVPVRPVVEPNGGVFWGLPPGLCFARGAVYLAALGPLLYALARRVGRLEDRRDRLRDLLLIFLFAFALIIVAIDFVIEPVTGVAALSSEVGILVFAVLCMVLFFFVHERMLARSERRLQGSSAAMLELLRATVMALGPDGVPPEDGSLEAVIEELRRGRGVLYDPAVVDACLVILEDGLPPGVLRVPLDREVASLPDLEG